MRILMLESLQDCGLVKKTNQKEAFIPDSKQTATQGNPEKEHSLKQSFKQSSLLCCNCTFD